MPDGVLSSKEKLDKLTKNLIAFNGEELAFISHGKVKLLSVNDYQIRDFSNFNDVIKLAYHPKNKHWLFIARQGGEIELWDIQLPVLKKRYATQRHNITQLSFAPNGEYLAIPSSHVPKRPLRFPKPRLGAKVFWTAILIFGNSQAIKFAFQKN